MDEKELKKTNLTVRVTPTELAKIKRACYRDEMKPTLFAHGAIMSALESLIAKQAKEGYVCSKPLL